MVARGPGGIGHVWWGLLDVRLSCGLLLRAPHRLSCLVLKVRCLTSFLLFQAFSRAKPPAARRGSMNGAHRGRRTHPDSRHPRLVQYFEHNFTILINSPNESQWPMNHTTRPLASAAGSSLPFIEPTTPAFRWHVARTATTTKRNDSRARGSV